MKRFANYEDIPSSAVYYGSEDGAGFICEALADSLENAEQPAFFEDADGVKHYFDLVNFNA